MLKIKKIAYFYSFLSRPQLKKYFSQSPLNEKEKAILPDQISEKILEDYLQDIEKDSTSFQKEFGFNDTLKDLRVLSHKKDKRFNVFFTIIWAFICTGGYKYMREIKR